MLVRLFLDTDPHNQECLLLPPQLLKEHLHVAYFGQVLLQQDKRCTSLKTLFKPFISPGHACAPLWVYEMFGSVPGGPVEVHALACTEEAERVGLVCVEEGKDSWVLSAKPPVSLVLQRLYGRIVKEGMVVGVKVLDHTWLVKVNLGEGNEGRGGAAAAAAAAFSIGKGTFGEWREASTEMRPSPSLYRGLDSVFTELKDLLHSMVSSALPIDMKSLLILGAQGVGKTTLVRAAARCVTAQRGSGFVFLTAQEMIDAIGASGSCDELLQSKGGNHETRNGLVVVIDDIHLLVAEKDTENYQAFTWLQSFLGRGLPLRTTLVAVCTYPFPPPPPSQDVSTLQSLFDASLNVPPSLILDQKSLLLSIMSKINQPICSEDSTPMTMEECVDACAARTNGYTARDLVQVCRLAVFKCLERGPPSQLLLSDFVSSFHSVPPSCLRDLPPSLPSAALTWDSFGGYQQVKSKIQKILQWPLLYQHTYKRMKIPPLPGLLLYGPSGCGKTFLASIIAQSMKVNFIALRSSDVFSKYLGDSEKKIREIFKKARQSLPSILFLDQLDAIGSERGGGVEGGGVYARVLSTLLNEMDGVGGGAGGLMVLAATNRKEAVDSALLRPGRLQECVYIGYPSVEDDYVGILTACSKDMPLEGGVDFEILVRQNFKPLAEEEGPLTCADLWWVCREAAMVSLRDEVGGKGDASGTITHDNFVIAIEKLRKKRRKKLGKKS